MIACIHEEFFAVQGRGYAIRGVCKDCGQLVTV
jgi:hypothetical protein